MSILLAGLSLVIGTASCKSSEDGSKAGPSAAKTGLPDTPAAVVAEPPKVAKPDESGIAWIENDYAAALKLAQGEGKPLLIDMWADWCHTCLAMKKGTLRDLGLSAISADFVWLAIDTEHPSSAKVMELFVPKVWPTFFVVSPTDESVQAIHAGSAPVAEFREFLLRGASGHLQVLQADGALLPNSPLAHLRSGDRARMQDEYAEAAAHYAAAREAGGENWDRAATTVKNQIAALAKLENKLACAEFAGAEVDFMAEQHNSSGADFMYWVSDCAKALKRPAAEALLDKALKGMRAILKDSEAALSYDDRSDALATARSIANKLGFPDLAATLALQQRALLAKAVSEAATPMEEMTYAWHQVEVHEYLGKGHAILPWIEALEAKLPNEYDPPYRRGWLLLKLGRHEEAHAAVARALPLALGARRGRILGLDAAIYKAEGNTEKEREVRVAIVSHFESLAPGLSPKKRLLKAKAELAKMDAMPASQ
ncbi:MAG: thioredoxin family protein [Myxococcales bacterium]|nr:thioredoxin family protein [Myxococcales bacterium]